MRYDEIPDEQAELARIIDLDLAVQRHEDNDYIGGPLRTLGAPPDTLAWDRRNVGVWDD